MGRTLAIASDGYWGGSGGGDTIQVLTYPLVGTIVNNDLIGITEMQEITGVITTASLIGIIDTDYELPALAFPMPFDSMWGVE